MGPGHLAVERYLGPCLISHRKPKKPPDDKLNNHPQQHHHQQQQQQQRYYHHNAASAGGWAGVPLISLHAASRRGGGPNNKNKPQQQQQHHPTDHTPLSRLAIHTQGAPLILSNGAHYGRKGAGKMPLKLVLPNQPPMQSATPHGTSPPVSSAGSDTQSVASDESHSEGSLPRIIKPRKRRKKERKPTTPTTPEQGGNNHNNSSIVTLQPYVPLCYEFDKFRQRNNNNRQKNVKETIIVPEEPILLQEPQQERQIEEEIIEPEMLLTSAVQCQCRYCDPVSQIWEFGRYSPSLGHGVRLSSLPVLRPCAAEFPWFLPPQHESLRRSQSEPVAPGLLPPSPPTTPKSTEPSRPLEVTSEIVTAHDGHRDIEIRFFLPREE